MTDNTRAARLEKLFAKILGGSVPVPANQKDLFIDAICDQDDKVSCISRLVSSNNGIPSIHAALRYDCSDSFVNNRAANLLKYLMAPEIEVVSGGSYLEKILLGIVIPPIFWEALRAAFDGKLLGAEAETCFAWLMYKLISFQTSETDLFRAIAREKDYVDKFLKSSSHETTKYAQQIKHVLETGKVAITSEGGFSAGGRHDNDFLDFREIAVIPTVEEMLSSKEPFLRTTYFMDDSNTKDDRVSIYLDNQFRLLREDMLSEMREELHVALGKTKCRYKPHIYEGLQVLDIRFGPNDKKRTKWALRFELDDDLPAFKNNRKIKDRVEYLKKHRRILSHQSPACLIVDNDLVAFALVDRDETELAESPPLISLQFEGEITISRTLSKLKSGKDIKLLSFDVAIFSYEPILKAIQCTKRLPLAQELLFWEASTLLPAPKDVPSRIITALRLNPCQDLRSLIGTQKSIKLDKPQGESFLNALTQRVSLIQGPPGTGKSFIGALLAKTIHDHTGQNILVVCYTNHALDQFLEDLIDVGIPENSIARLGGTSKATSRTVQLTLRNQESTFRFSYTDHEILDDLKQEIEQKQLELESHFQSYKDSATTLEVILGWLKSEEPDLFNAFQVPLQEDGMTLVHNKNPSFLFHCWLKCRRPPRYLSELTQQYPQLWAMKKTDRQSLVKKWENEIEKERLSNFYSVAKQYNELIHQLEKKFSERDTHKLQDKRIIGCTTTAAAKYTELLQSVSPSVLLVEEAGEILESHILTALGRKKNQLILIGDHKQLRPRVKSYPLTVEKGDGFDLNMSLFERLVLKGYPHTALSQQHRMRPEISALVRYLTYPDLVDAPRTQGRPDLRGVTDNLIIIHHSKLENEMTGIEDRAEGAKSSKQNTHEVQMVLKIVRYLGQQGYGTEDMVVLTPYLGQLQKLMMALKNETDPVLNDLDSHELIRAGLLSQAAANAKKRPLRLATIDNYQGEESDIVIISLTRSNPEHDIGFMCSPERVNVMLSRARNALIMIGNTDTFRMARKGRELWSSLLDLLAKGGHIYEGLPVGCERHPKKTTVLKSPDDFNNEVPDGGCKEPCGILLNCGIHPCQLSCHQTTDHSHMLCQTVVDSVCSNGHDISYHCHQGPSLCSLCEKERQLIEKQQEDDLVQKRKREREKKDHELRIADLQMKIQIAREDMHDAQTAAEHERARVQKEEDLQKAQELAAKARQKMEKKEEKARTKRDLKEQARLQKAQKAQELATKALQKAERKREKEEIAKRKRELEEQVRFQNAEDMLKAQELFTKARQKAERKQEKEETARRKRELEKQTRLQKAQELATEARQKAEKKREEEETARRKRELGEQARLQKAQELAAEARQKVEREREEEETARRKRELEQARLQKEEELAAEARQKAERKREEEETARRKRELEEQVRLQKEEDLAAEARQKAERKREEDEIAQRKHELEEQAQLWQKEKDLRKAQELATKAHQLQSSPVDFRTFLSKLSSRARPAQNKADASKQPAQSPTSPNDVTPKDLRHSDRRSDELELNPGIPDHLWQSLQEARRMREEVESLREEQAELERQNAERREEEEMAQRKRLIRQKEVERMKEYAIQRDRERIERELMEKERKEEERRRHQEAPIQRKLWLTGVCPVGRLQWLPQGGGYRCACGFHWVSNAQVGI